MSLKQKKIKFRPRIKLTRNIYINKFIFLDFSMERWGGGGALRIVVVVTKKDQTVKLVDKGYFNELFFNNFKQVLSTV